MIRLEWRWLPFLSGRHCHCKLWLLRWNIFIFSSQLHILCRQLLSHLILLKLFDSYMHWILILNAVCWRSLNVQLIGVRVIGISAIRRLRVWECVVVCGRRHRHLLIVHVAAILVRRWKRFLLYQAVVALGQRSSSLITSLWILSRTASTGSWCVDLILLHYIYLCFLTNEFIGSLLASETLTRIYT